MSKTFHNRKAKLSRGKDSVHHEHSVNSHPTCRCSECGNRIKRPQKNLAKRAVLDDMVRSLRPSQVEDYVSLINAQEPTEGFDAIDYVYSYESTPDAPTEQE